MQTEHHMARMSQARTENIAGHYCGQTQPHDAHTWQTPPIYGSAQFIQTYQCAGVSPSLESEVAS